MKVVVLGAGVIGVTTAWYLARAGHEVTVIERRAGSSPIWCPAARPVANLPCAADERATMTCMSRVKTALRVCAFAAAFLTTACTPQQTLLMSVLPAGTVPILVSHLERVEDTNRTKVAEFEARGDWEGLLKFANENLAKDPGTSDWWLVAGYANTRLERHERAAQCYGEVIRLEPDEAPGWHLLAQSYRAMKQPQRAVAVLDRALLVLRDSPMTHFMMGETYGDLGRLPAAADAYRQALRLDPRFVQAWYRLGYTELQNGRVTEAKQAVQALEQLDPPLAAALARAVSARQ